uniref:UDP-N-acetylglucosamine 2-epimerase (Non-hydrolyzing) n=1 Tax=candidate division WOR-3 bacterium TaxID=2052148 RepID=A0A7V3KMV7_UNCW3
MFKVSLVVGARPNFVKAAPLFYALKKIPSIEVELVHTGQHYDVNMSDVFFSQLELPIPDVNLEVGSKSHGKQTGEMLIKLEEHYTSSKPDLVVVFGDTNSTLAGALSAVKLGIKVAHVEAGVRSFDMTMPEEVNRILVDRISDLLFIPDKYANSNLKKEGIPQHKIFLVGNIVIDTLVKYQGKVESIEKDVLNKANLKPFQYAVATIHRAGNVDEEKRLKEIMNILERLAQKIPIVFPVHPRTRKKIEEMGYKPEKGLKFLEPLGYLEFIALLKNSRIVLTDSGGVQTESTYLGVPCLTLRENTEWIITLRKGTNHLVGYDIDLIERIVDKILSDGPKGEKVARKPSKIEYWDGKTSERISEIISNFLKEQSH